jgi:hypothetical protein
MPWETTKTTVICNHCASRGFEHVYLLEDVFFTEREGGFKWFHYDEEGGKLEQPRKIAVKGVIRDYKPHTTVTTDENGEVKKTVGLLTRLRCPHFQCASNNAIRERNRANRRKNR